MTNKNKNQRGRGGNQFKSRNRFELLSTQNVDESLTEEDTPLQSRFQRDSEESPQPGTSGQKVESRKRKEKSDDSDSDTQNTHQKVLKPEEAHHLSDTDGLSERSALTDEEEEFDTYRKLRNIYQRISKPNNIERLFNKCNDVAYFLSYEFKDQRMSIPRFRHRLERAKSEYKRREQERLHMMKEIKELKEENGNLKLQLERQPRKAPQANKSTNTECKKSVNKATNTKGTKSVAVGTNTDSISVTDNTTNEPSELVSRVTRIEQAILSLVEQKQAAPLASASYAQVAKRKNTKPRNQQIAPTRKNRHVVTIYPREGSRETEINSENVRDALLERIGPGKDLRKIRSIRKIQKGGVLVETATREDKDKLLQDEVLRKAGYQTGEPAKKSPKLVFFNTPKELTEGQLLAALKKTSVTEEESKGIKPLFKTRKSNCWVVETTPSLRERLLSSGRLFIEWSSCPVRDYVVACRCFRCQAFGHVAKHCRASVDTCGHCAQEGHTYKVCPNKEDKPSCINCKRANKPHEHSSRSDECQAYARAKRSLVNKTDY